MPSSKDPTDPIRKHAAKLAGVEPTTACNQSGFKVGKRAFLYIGPGAKGQGFKAMFKLERSIAQAEQLAAKEPDRYGVGSNGWVSVRFTAEKPLAKAIWENWLKESYALAGGDGAKRATPAKKATATRKKATSRKRA